MDRLTSGPAQRSEFERIRREEALRSREGERPAPPVAVEGRSARAALSVATGPAAPFLGPRPIDADDVRELWDCFDHKSLFRLSWGGANAKGPQWDFLLREEFQPRLERYQHQAEREAVIAPRRVYGYFPAAGDGDDIVIYDPADPAYANWADSPFHARSAIVTSASPITCGRPKAGALERRWSRCRS